MGACVGTIGRPEVFLTSVALLTAILVVWAQQWLNTYKIYKDRILRTNCTIEYYKRVESFSNFWLGWVYLAILIALTAFAWAARDYFIIGNTTYGPEVAIGLLGVSLYMTGVQVFQSWVSALSKFCSGEDFDKSVCLLSPCHLKIIMSVLIVLGVSIFLCIKAAL